MRVKSLALGTLAALGLFALSGTQASAQYFVSPGHHHGGYVPVPVYRPAYVVPSYGYGGGYSNYGYNNYGYSRPGVSFGYSSGYGYRPNGYGYGGGFGSGYGASRGGYYGGRGGSGFSFGFSTFR